MSAATPNAITASIAPDSDHTSRRLAGRSLAILTTVYMFNYMDRTILSIVAQPIKDDLQLSDTQLGFLGGMAFALFYTFLGIPIARFADRCNRRNLLAVCLFLWSAMTVICGMAQSFLQLFAARVGVAIGEAGGGPSSHSMISDWFPPARRATALAVFALGIPLGGMFGNLVGGVASDLLGWRGAFVTVGLPGLVFTLVLLAAVREPQRGAFDQEHHDHAPAFDLRSVLARLRSLRSIVYLTLASALHALAGFGIALWLPSLFIRGHHWTTTQIGTGLFLLGFATLIGTLTGGRLADRLASRDVRWYAWLPAIATLAAIPLAAFTYLWHDPVIALAVYAIPSALHSFYLGPTFSVAQNLVPPRMRATVSSLILFMLNLIAMGLGPQLVGFMSDSLLMATGNDAESLRWSMIITLCINIPAVAFYCLSAAHIRQDWHANVHTAAPEQAA
jgi:predicted MFS family arabinose efflux permease